MQQITLMIEAMKFRQDGAFFSPTLRLMVMINERKLTRLSKQNSIPGQG